jgi:excisionase family DNA binding protein
MAEISIPSTIFSAYPEIVTIAQMEKMLNISKNSCYRLMRSHAITSVRIGRKYLIPKESIIRFMKNKVS